MGLVSNNASVYYRRMTIPLDGSSTTATVQPLMKDDDSYTYCELPLVNPQYKVQASSMCSLFIAQSFRGQLLHACTHACSNRAPPSLYHFLYCLIRMKASTAHA